MIVLLIKKTINDCAFQRCQLAKLLDITVPITVKGGKMGDVIILTKGYEALNEGVHHGILE